MKQHFIPVAILTFLRRADSVLICRGPNLVPDLFEVPMSRGTPTKHAASPGLVIYKKTKE